MLDFLKGKKTYLMAVLMASVTVTYNLGYLDKATYDMLMALLSAGAVSTVAAKMNRVDKQVGDKF